jgi:hypothetical protein
MAHHTLGTIRSVHAFPHEVVGVDKSMKHADKSMQKFNMTPIKKQAHEFIPKMMGCPEEGDN